MLLKSGHVTINMSENFIFSCFADAFCCVYFSFVSVLFMTLFIQNY